MMTAQTLHGPPQAPAYMDFFKNLGVETPSEFFDKAISLKNDQIGRAWAAFRIETGLATWAVYAFIDAAVISQSSTFTVALASMMAAAEIPSYLSTNSEYKNELEELSVLLAVKTAAEQTEDPDAFLEKAIPIVIMKMADREEGTTGTSPHYKPVVKISDDIPGSLLKAIKQGHADIDSAKAYIAQNRPANTPKLLGSLQEAFTYSAQSWGPEFPQTCASIYEGTKGLLHRLTHHGREFVQDLRRGTLYDYYHDMVRVRDSHMAHMVEGQRATDSAVEASGSRIRDYMSEGRWLKMRAVSELQESVKKMSREYVLTNSGVLSSVVFTGAAGGKGLMSLAHGVMTLNPAVMIHGALDLTAGFLNIAPARTLSERAVELSDKLDKYRDKVGAAVTHYLNHYPDICETACFPQAVPHPTETLQHA